MLPHTLNNLVFINRYLNYSAGVLKVKCFVATSKV